MHGLLCFRLGHFVALGRTSGITHQGRRHVWSICESEMFEGVPSHKHHADDGNVPQHVVTNKHELAHIEAKCQAPKTSQQDTGHIPDIGAGVTHGIEIGIHDVPTGAGQDPKEFQNCKHVKLQWLCVDCDPGYRNRLQDDKI